MRKPRKLPPDALAPFQLRLPAADPHRPPDPDAPPPELLDWAAVFGNTNPVEFEVGFGKGLFLVNAGVARPDRNFFGVEIVRKYQLYATNRIAARELPNVKTCCADAKQVFQKYTRTGSVAVVHVFFPDPWWKTKHKKRLLFTPEFAAEVRRVLAPGGHLHFVTDVADYFEWVSETIAAVPAFRPLPPPDEKAPEHDMDYLTNFERKFRKEGRPIYRSRHENHVDSMGSA
ncbi:MAG: tRNA (guanosine(46)-N7)-methyltransferase TrmB [Fimbriiglobus sp.]